MSKTRFEKAQCPECGHEQEIKIWDSIDVDENPEAKEEILTNRLFLYECEECGFTAPKIQRCLYHDKEKKLLVYMVPDFDSEKAMKIRIMMQDMGNIIPEDRREGYVCRIVPTANALKEKIMIRDEGLDDRIIELMKLYYMSQVKDSLEGEDKVEVLFDSSNAKNGFVFLFPERNPLFGEMNMEAYQILAEDFTAEAERLTPEGLADIDLMWAEKLASNE